jgi:hypothetical protein
MAKKILAIIGALIGGGLGITHSDWFSSTSRIWSDGNLLKENSYDA